MFAIASPKLDKNPDNLESDSHFPIESLRDEGEPSVLCEPASLYFQ
jgi:hypothetical protein